MLGARKILVVEREEAAIEMCRRQPRILRDDVIGERNAQLIVALLARPRRIETKEGQRLGQLMQALEIAVHRQRQLIDLEPAVVRHRRVDGQRRGDLARQLALERDHRLLVAGATGLACGEADHRRTG